MKTSTASGRLKFCRQKTMRKGGIHGDTMARECASLSGDANLGSLRSFRVQTTSPTAAHLSEALGPFCGDDSLALPLAPGLSVGTVTRFVVSLQGGQAVFRGRAQVLSVRAAAPDELGSVRLKVLEVVDETRDFWGALLQRKRASSRMPPPPPGRKLPPGTVPCLEPEPVLWASLVTSVFYGEDDQTPPVLIGARAPGEGLAASPTRLTGKTAGYVGKSMVARKSDWPPWALAGGAKVRSTLAAVWAMVPVESRPVVARVGPWAGFWMVGLLCGLWWSPAKMKMQSDPPAAQHMALPSVVAATAAPVDLPAPPTPRRGPDRCMANLVTEPAGAQVFWGETALGETPLQEATVPCGRALVSLKRARYEPVLVTVTATMDGPVTFAQKLKRPQAELLITSEPAGAEVFVDDALAGKTPARLTVAQFQTTSVRVEKAGFEAVGRQVRVEAADKELRVRLQRAKARKRSKRR